MDLQAGVLVFRCESADARSQSNALDLIDGSIKGETLIARHWVRSNPSKTQRDRVDHFRCPAAAL